MIAANSQTQVAVTLASLAGVGGVLVVGRGSAARQGGMGRFIRSRLCIGDAGQFPGTDCFHDRYSFLLIRLHPARPVSAAARCLWLHYNTSPRGFQLVLMLSQNFKYLFFIFSRNVFMTHWGKTIYFFTNTIDTRRKTCYHLFIEARISRDRVICNRGHCLCQRILYRPFCRAVKRGCDFRY